MITPQTTENIKKYSQVIGNLKQYIIDSKLEDKINQLEQEVNNDGLWSNPEKARQVLQEKSLLEKNYKSCNNIIDEFETTIELLELAELDDNKDEILEYESVLNSICTNIDQIETRRLLSGKADANNAFIEINSGAGGTESQDWANMLLRMYTRWAEAEGFKTEVVEFNNGEEAGIKSATIKIKGDYAYGLLKTEIGVHRLVRISPFDSNNRRHTSFASVFAYPEVNDDIEIEVKPDDLKIDTFRASGAGGQHVNTTDSAIRITHIPSKIVVQCQNQRSQHKNKDEALKMLKAKLYELELQKQTAEKQELEDTKTDNSWGHQIRSYVMHPYKMVKDLRTNVETSNVEKILDGDLNAFIQAELNRINQGQ
ncbi:MAG TPA: peptide chain release factor 2 [Alphaproteobacteria bacterium]|nr:peptide chain release factor 2 [Alphaproteobacteria bacterium]